MEGDEIPDMASGDDVTLSTTESSLGSNMSSIVGNVTGKPGNSSSYIFYRTEQLIFLSALFVFIIVSNVFVLAAILMSKNRKSRMNFFIIHLAIADLSMGLIVVLVDLIWKVTVAWYGGHIGCKIIRFMQCTATFASTYVLVALSIDRVNAIARPLNFTARGNARRWLIGGAWFAAMLLSVPMFVLSEERLGRTGVNQCIINLPKRWHWQVYLSLMAMLVFILPAIIITVCYTVIVGVIWNKGSYSSSSSSSVASSSVTSTFQRHSLPYRRYSFRRKGAGGALQYSMRRGLAAMQDDELHQQQQPPHHGQQQQQQHCRQTNLNSSSRGVIPQAKIKTIKMTLAIVLVFIFCWSPYFVFDLLDVFGYIPSSPHKSKISIFIQSLAPLNSAANPVIYCLFSTRDYQGFRCRWLQFKRWICCSAFWGRRHRAGSRNCLGGSGGLTCSGVTDYTLPNDKFKQRMPDLVTPGRGLLEGGIGAACRRHSATPYVKGSLNEIENEILLKHLRKGGRACGSSSGSRPDESGD